MRFHLDEHVDQAIAHALRLRGIDVTTTIDADLRGASDEQHLEFANRTQRVIYTQDSDFVKLHHEGIEHVGIVYGPAKSRAIGEIVRYLCLIHDCLEPNEMIGEIHYL